MLMSDLMKVPIFQSASVVAGKQGLTRKVGSVNMMDAPDILEYLRPNEFLLTTAYEFKDNADALEALVRGMAAKGCAGLGVKAKRFLGEIPRSVSHIADELGFPVIELPMSYTLGEILSATLDHILGRRSEELGRALQAIETRTKQWNAQFFSDLLDGMSFSDGEITRMAKINGLEMCSSYSCAVLQIKQMNTEPVPTLPACGDLVNKIDEGKTCTVLPARKHHPLTVQATEVYLEHLFRELWLKEYGTDEYLHVGHAWSGETQPDEPEIPFLLFHKQGVWVLIWGVRKEMATRNSEMQDKGILHGFQKLREVMEQANHLSLSIGIGRRVASLHEISGSYRQAIAALRHASHSGHRMFDPPNHVVQYQAQNLPDLLLLIPQTDLQDFCDRTMGPLLHTKNKERKMLLTTLRTYLEFNGNLTDTAKHLYLHRNSVAYRLQRCSDLLNCDLRDPETTLNLRIALLIMSEVL